MRGDEWVSNSPSRCVDLAPGHSLVLELELELDRLESLVARSLGV